jgi:hypothetical protein
MTTRKELANIKGFSEAKIQKLLYSGSWIVLLRAFMLILTAAKLVPSFGGFQTGSECLIQRRDVRRLSTGCTALNEILGMLR